MFRLPNCFVRLALVGGLAIVAARASAQTTDQVYLTRGMPAKGVVTEMTKDTVTLDMSGISRPFQVNEIVRIAFVDDPSELGNARNAVQQRNYSLALQELKKLDGQPPDNKFVAADVAYYKALCMARLAMTEGGDKPAALKALLDWVKANPNNYHFYQSAEVLGDLAVATGEYADAARYYGGLSNAPWPDYQMRGNNAVGRALLSEKKFADALQKFDAVIASELTTPEATEQKQFATVGKAVCLAETGKADEGIAMLNEIINNNDPTEVALFARTYNALGNCYLKMSKPKDALRAFLFTDILFYADAESHAEALYRLSKLWNDVNRSDRAVQARNTLRERYAGSRWASLE